MYVNVPSVKFHENVAHGSRADTCGQLDGHDAANRRFLLFVLTRLKSLQGLLFGAPNVFKFQMLMDTAQGSSTYSRSCDSRHMRSRSTAAAVQRGDPLGKLVLLGNPVSYTLFVGTGSVGRRYKSTAGKNVRQCRDVQATGCLLLLPPPPPPLLLVDFLVCDT
jgi:hypothetical protein